MPTHYDVIFSALAQVAIKHEQSGRNILFSERGSCLGRLELRG